MKDKALPLVSDLSGFPHEIRGAQRDADWERMQSLVRLAESIQRNKGIVKEHLRGYCLAWEAIVVLAEDAIVQLETGKEK